MSTAGYSGTPLAKKLGIKPGFMVQVFNAPKSYFEFFHEFPDEVVLVNSSESVEVDFIHIFATTPKELESSLEIGKPNLKKNGILWISWPKKSSKIPTEIDKFAVMKAGQDCGLVDTKVAAVDDQWSGHKFMYRLKDRK
ncbi:DUF3052 family protein [Flagellimonas meridianipacifica]|uniref:DUF3052 family protein n=1 Tax=Flagellimonas meridianipacifica TaxID=1080225 RepID=A0A2T0MIB2_9FLAO|nr:DUF3052 family protein [Allomuricauda pacifica]PRX57285.1 Protein of unknown function (DUF3052) [Allomuricauda pacifica]